MIGILRGIHWRGWRAVTLDKACQILVFITIKDDVAEIDRLILVEAWRGAVAAIM
ncbi:hypothetical protein LG58_2181 [Kosakonia radicincitans YD4]|nr:hypothetical protein LG58_2181 [Kosakonia radicincitans YD4]